MYYRYYFSNSVIRYTSLEVKLWNIDKDTECVLSPSGRELVLQEDNSFITNYITSVVGNDKYSVARFSTGKQLLRTSEKCTLLPIKVDHPSTGHGQQTWFLLVLNTSLLYRILNGSCVVIYIYAFKAPVIFLKFAPKKFFEKKLCFQKKKFVHHIVTLFQNGRCYTKWQNGINLS